MDGPTREPASAGTPGSTTTTWLGYEAPSRTPPGHSPTRRRRPTCTRTRTSRDPYPQSTATGEALADALATQVPNLRALRFGKIDFRRTEFTVPLENNPCKAAAAAGIFGDRPTYEAGQPAGRAGSDLLTEV